MNQNPSTIKESSLFRSACQLLPWRTGRTKFFSKITVKQHLAMGLQIIWLHLRIQAYSRNNSNSFLNQCQRAVQLRGEFHLQISSTTPVQKSQRIRDTIPSKHGLGDLRGNYQIYVGSHEKIQQRMPLGRKQRRMLYLCIDTSMRWKGPSWRPSGLQKK
uniref:Uncharacterized protein n=1 Tax=Rhizophora mucronata TaxID=61149 RepID=A0A2P2PN35_RHIMU